MKSKLILIGGIVTSGKTTIANILKEKYNVEMKTFDDYIRKVAKQTNQNAISDLPKLINPALELILEDAEKLPISSLNLRFAVTKNLNYEHSLGLNKAKEGFASYKRTLATQDIEAFKNKNIEVYAFGLTGVCFSELDDFKPPKHLFGSAHYSDFGILEEDHKEYLMMRDTIKDIKQYVPVKFNMLSYKSLKKRVKEISEISELKN